jgi:tetratricopeptide (TPR) repeat protein
MRKVKKMKRVQIDCIRSKLCAREKFVLILVALAALWASALAQEVNADSWYKKGQELTENESYEEALNAYDRAIELDPENPRIWMGKGDTQIRMGNYNESRETYENALNITNKSLEANQQDAKGWLVKGDLLKRLYRDNEALESYNRSLEIDPKNKETWLNKGNALDTLTYQLQGPERIRALEDAIIAYNQAIEIDPSYGNAWMNKGYSLRSLAAFNKNLSEYNDSLKAFDKAVELIPSNDTGNLALAWDGRAITLMSMGNTLEANGRQEEARARREEAVNDYSKAIELGPSFAGLEAQLYRAGILADLGKYNESLAAYDNAIEAKPNYPPGDYSMYVAMLFSGKGVVLEKMGDHGDALKAFDNAIELDSTSAEAWKGKGDSLKALGRQAEADVAFAKAKELGIRDDFRQSFSCIRSEETTVSED